MTNISRTRAVELAQKAWPDFNINAAHKGTADELHAFAEAVAAEVLSQQGEIGAWREKDGDTWVYYDKDDEPSTFEHITEHQKYRHGIDVFPLFTRPPAPEEVSCPECGCHFTGSLPFDYKVTAPGSTRLVNTAAPAPVNQMLVEALKKIEAALINMGAKSSVAYQETASALAAAETAPDHSELVKRLRGILVEPWDEITKIANKAADALEGK